VTILDLFNPAVQFCIFCIWRTVCRHLTSLKRTDTSSAIERACNSFTFPPKQITIYPTSRHDHWIISYPQYLHQLFIDWFWFFLLWPETEECVNTAGENTLKTLLTPRDKYKLRFRGQFLWLLRWHFRFELEFLHSATNSVASLGATICIHFCYDSAALVRLQACKS